jgi:hypothetical protein
LTPAVVGAADDPVQVTKDKMGFVRNYDIVRSSMEQGNTEWFFHCFPNFAYRYETRGNQVTITPYSVQMHIGLDVTQTVPHRCSDKLQAHEDGHVEICKQIYADAERIAHDYCEEAIGKPFTASGATEKDATDNAIDVASHYVCDRYSAKTGKLCDRVSQIYDEITRHGLADVPESKAIDQAFKRASR